MRKYAGLSGVRLAASQIFIPLVMCFVLVSPSTILAGGVKNSIHPDITELTTPIQDMEATVHVSQADTKELEKIGRDFGTTYRFRKLTFQYKQPDKLRLEAHSNILGLALLILNGPLRYYSIPKLHLRNKENLLNSPAKRQTLLEYGGLLSTDTLHLMNSKFLRSETINGDNLSVYELKYQGAPSGSYYLLWIDPKTHESQ